MCRTAVSAASDAAPQSFLQWLRYFLTPSLWRQAHPLCVWELATGRQVAKTILADGGAGPVAFSPDGQSFAMGFDKQVRRWQFRNEKGLMLVKEIAPIDGLDSKASSLAFFPDGKLLAVGLHNSSASNEGGAQMRTALLALLVAVVYAEPMRADGELEKPVKLTAAGRPIDVEHIGHSAPFVGDFDEDGINDLLVGQFHDGRLRIYRNIGSNRAPRFDTHVWFKAGGDFGRVPVG